MHRLISVFGLFVMIAVAWLMSSNRRKLNVRIIVGGLLGRSPFPSEVTKP